MTEDEKQMALALAACTFVPGIGTKRFARNMAFAAGQPDPQPLTDGQRKYLCTAVIRFRRQIDPAIVALARSAVYTAGTA